MSRAPAKTAKAITPATAAVTVQAITKSRKVECRGVAPAPSLWLIRTTFTPSRRVTRTMAAAPPAAIARDQDQQLVGVECTRDEPEGSDRQILGVSLRPRAKLAPPLVNQ